MRGMMFVLGRVTMRFQNFDSFGKSLSRFFF